MPYFFEDTPEVDKAIKTFCEKNQNHMFSQHESERKKEQKNKNYHGKPIQPLRIFLREEKVRDKPYGKEYMIVSECRVKDDEFTIRVQEELELNEPNADGMKILRGGELWIDKSHRVKVKKDDTPLIEIQNFSLDNYSSILDHIGLELHNNLKFVPEDQTKYKTKNN